MKRNPLMAATAASMLLAVVGSTAWAQTSPPTAAYLPRSEALATADQLVILDIIARMNQAIDASDYAAYAGFFTEDGVLDSGFGSPANGREAIIASLNQSAPFITNKRHVASNVVINGVAQSATAVYYLTVFERNADLSIVGTAMITDEFRRGDSGWQVVRHTTRMDPATLKAISALMSAKNN